MPSFELAAILSVNLSDFLIWNQGWVWCRRGSVDMVSPEA